MEEAQQSSDIYGILIDSGAPRILVLLDETGNGSLPHLHLPDRRVWVANVDVICVGMRKILAADVTVLRNIYSSHDTDRAHTELIYVLENHQPDWLPPANARWIGRHELETLSFASPEQRAAIEGILQEAESGHVPGLRPHWARLGWFDRASAWMREQLEGRGYILSAPIEQIRTWGISCVLRVQTDHGHGAIFFKVATALPLFGNEPALMNALSERFPDVVPAPLAIEPTQRWMLMRDFGEELRSMPDLERWENATRRFGQLQLQTVTRIDELLSIGCLDRRLHTLAAQIDPLLADEDALSPLSEAEHTEIQALAPRLKAMCQELASYAVPYTLNHGDLHSGNITGQTLLFYDWTDACIAHPFLDLTTLIKDAEEYDSGARVLVVNTYLNLWTAYEPIDRLRTMWQLAEPLGALHQAVSYQHILATLEPTSKQEMLTGAADWLRRMVRMMPS